MKLRWLEIFHAVVSTGSVSEAARSLAITQPTATRLLRDFEASVEAPLFNRVKGRLVPTTAARRLAEETRGLFEAVADFEMAAGDVRHEPAPDLRVFANEELARCVMPATLAEVMVRRSDMVFETHRRHEPSAIAEALLTGPSSIAFAFEPILHPRIHAIAVVELRFHFLFRRPAGGGGVVPLLLPPPGGDLHRLLGPRAMEAGPSGGRRIVAPDLDCLRRWVLDRLGGAFFDDVEADDLSDHCERADVETSAKATIWASFVAGDLAASARRDLVIRCLGEVVLRSRRRLELLGSRRAADGGTAGPPT